jgi:hypothetical protein
MAVERKSIVLIVAVLLIFTAVIFDSQSGMRNTPDAQVLSTCEKEPYEVFPLVSLLGKPFEEIQCLLGEPDQAGFSYDYGPHNYIQYSNTGAVRFCSPAGADYLAAESIIASGTLDVLDVSVGMTFDEIVEVQGTADYGPEYGMDMTYYLVYFFPDHPEQHDPFTVTFAAESMDDPTYEAFIKWEGYDAKHFADD